MNVLGPTRFGATPPCLTADLERQNQVKLSRIPGKPVFAGSISKNMVQGSCFVLFLSSLCVLGDILLSLPVPRERDDHDVTVAGWNRDSPLKEKSLQAKSWTTL